MGVEYTKLTKEKTVAAHSQNETALKKRKTIVIETLGKSQMCSLASCRGNKCAQKIKTPNGVFLERKTGFEPATPCLASRCSTTELHPRRLRISWFCKVTHTLWCERRDLNPHRSPHWILSPARLPISPLSLVTRAGFEPATP